MVVAGCRSGWTTGYKGDRPGRPEAHGVLGRVENLMKLKEIDHLWIYSIDLPFLMQCPSHQYRLCPCVCPSCLCVCLGVSVYVRASHHQKQSGPWTDYLERNRPRRRGSAGLMVPLSRLHWSDLSPAVYVCVQASHHPKQ